MNQPLTDEQIWGEPGVAANSDGRGPNYCPYLERSCSFWDGDCRAVGICHWLQKEKGTEL